MRPVDLNFATAPFRNYTPYYLAYGLGVLVIGAFTAYNAYAYMTYSKNQAELESDYAQKKVRLEALYEQSGRLQGEIAKQDFALLSERAAFANKMLLSRRFSWTALLNSLEEVQPYQVRMLSLRPNLQSKGIYIEARAVARDLKSFWTFQQNLQNDAHFRHVYPGGYLKNNELGELVFNVAFNYFPDGTANDFVGLTPEEIAQLQIADAPGAHRGGGEADVDEDDLPPLEEEEPPPQAHKPAPSKGGVEPPTAAQQAPPGVGPRGVPISPAAAPPVVRGADANGRGAGPGAVTNPPGIKPPVTQPGGDQTVTSFGASPQGAPPPSADPNAARPPVRHNLPERGPALGSGGVRNNPPPPQKDPKSGYPPINVDDKEGSGDSSEDDGS